MSSVAKLAFASATLVSSSALWQAFGEGTMPVETAVTRFAVVLVVAWIALTVVAELAFPAPTPAQLGIPQAAAAQHHAAPLHHEEAATFDEGHPNPAPPTSMPNA